MKVLLAYAHLYAECLVRTASGLRKNTWTLLLPLPLFLAYLFLGKLLTSLGLDMVGRILFGLAFDALASCYLYFTGEVVSHSRVSLGEFQRSIRAYFWSVLNIMFVIWIAEYLLGMALRGNPKGTYLFNGIILAAVVMLNAVPEVIYVRNTFGGIATIQTAVSFMQQNWIEWLLPNALIGGLLYLASSWLLRPDLTTLLLGLVVLGALLHAAMVFRGHLFTVLDSSSHRQRMFRYRWP